MILKLNIKKKIYLKLLIFFEELEYKIALYFYRKKKLRYFNSLNKTYIKSNKKIGLVVVSDSNVINIKNFIRYHQSIGINEIYLSTSKKILGFKNLFLFNRSFKNFNQKKICNQLIKNAFKNKCEYVFILDDDEFLYTNKEVNLDKINRNFIFSMQINFLSKINDNFGINPIYSLSRYYSEKRLIFNKDLRINNYISKKLILIKKNDKYKFITKGNHNYNDRIFQNLASTSIFLLHTKIIRTNDIIKRISFEKNRIKYRKNQEESVTSSYFGNLNKIDIKNLWKLNSISENCYSNSCEVDYSAKSSVS